MFGVISRKRVRLASIGVKVIGEPTPISCVCGCRACSDLETFDSESSPGFEAMIVGGVSGHVGDCMEKSCAVSKIDS